MLSHHLAHPPGHFQFIMDSAGSGEDTANFLGTAIADKAIIVALWISSQRGCMTTSPTLIGWASVTSTFVLRETPPPGRVA